MTKKLTTLEFITKAKSIHANKYSYNNVMYINSLTKVNITCKIHGDFQQTPNKHLLGQGCPICANEINNIDKRLTTEQFIEKAKLIHGDKYDYSNVKYINNRTKICIICPIHGEFFQRPISHLQGKGCPKCNDSKLEKEIEVVLLNNCVEYYPQKRFKWLGSLSLDFYLPSINVAIECQGNQHFGLGGWSDKFDFEKQFERDNLKHKLCKQHGINILYYCKNEIEFNGIYNEYNTFFSTESLINCIKKGEPL